MKQIILALASVLVGFAVGGGGVYLIFSNEYNKSIAEQALIDINQQLAIISRLEKNNENNAISITRQDIDLIIHRHFLNVIKYGDLIHDEKSKNYEKSTLRKLFEYWDKYPPFDEIFNLPLNESTKTTKELFESTRNYIKQYEK